MFISKKNYNEILDARDRALDLSKETIALNERMLQEAKEIQALNKSINNANDELLRKVKELDEENTRLVEKVKKLNEENTRILERLASKCKEYIAWNNNETLRVFTEALEEELNKIPQHHFTLLEVLDRIRSLHEELKEI